VTALVCCALMGPSLAEPPAIRLGPIFWKSYDDLPFTPPDSVSSMQDQLRPVIRHFAKSAEDCQKLVDTPLGKDKPVNKLRFTWTILQSLKAQCWAIMHADPEVRIVRTTAADALTPEMIFGVMAYASALAAGNEEWMKTLTTFSGGEIKCRDAWTCLLFLPDGKDWPDESAYFDMLMVTEDEKFILVSQAYQGRVDFVYGVQWRETEDGGQVVSIFPDILKP
jgi:hypothetical protein